jgi:hypothetical protein
MRAQQGGFTMPKTKMIAFAIATLLSSGTLVGAASAMPAASLFRLRP